MGAEEKDDDERGASESSGLDDIMSLGAAFGTDEDEDGSPNIAGDVSEDHDLDNLSAGYGGAAAASLVDADASDLVGEAANKPAAPRADPPRPDPAAESLTAAKKVKPPEPPPKAASKPPASPKAAAAEKPAKPSKPAKPATTSESGRSVRTTDADASAAAALVASTAAASQIRRVSPPAARKEEGGGGMTWLIVIGLLALLGGGYWFVFVRGAGTDHETVAHAAAEPVEKKAPPVVAKAAPPPEPVIEEPVVEPKLDLPAEVIEEPVEEEVESSIRKKRNNKDKGDDKADTKEAAPEPEPKEEEPKEEAPPPQLTEDQYRTECLLNPNKPGCAEAKRKYGDKYKDLDKTLPDKLSESDVRTGVSPRKSAAKACGSKFGIEAGTIIRVKLSIEGDSGKVLSAAAMDPHAGTPVGKCVADALKDAKFRRFKSGQQGTTYPVTM